MAAKDFLFTSESVSEGHPDKMCDQISDAILDAHLSGDPDSRVACEALTKTGMIVIAGEITSKTKVSYNEIARDVVRDIGYTDSSTGFDGNTCAILTAVERQSPDISQGVTEGGRPGRVQSVVGSTQHAPDVLYSKLRETVIDGVIRAVIPADYLDKSTVFHVNPTGRFVVGGPQGDCALTGRKIMVDTYGGMGRH